MAGHPVCEDDIDSILRELIAEPDAQTKGFILDLDFAPTNERTWVSRITRNEIMGE